MSATNRARCCWRSRLAACVLASLPAVALAQETRGSAPPTSPSANAHRFLKIESSFWTRYGIRLSRSAQEDLGPGFLALSLADAVRGSPEAENHAGHARTWAALDLGFGLVGIALLAASLFTYADDHGGRLGGWPDFVGRDGGALLNLGWIACVTGALLSREMTYREIMLSVNAHNFDVAMGRIR